MLEPPSATAGRSPIVCPRRSPHQAWHAWAVMNFEAVLHYKHQNQARDEKKKLRHASGANITNAATAATTAATATATATSTEGSNSESDAESSENSPTPSPLQKKVTEVPVPPSSREDRPSARRSERWGSC